MIDCIDVFIKDMFLNPSTTLTFPPYKLYHSIIHIPPTKAIIIILTKQNSKQTNKEE